MSSIDKNKAEMGHAHVKHENRLFMKDPFQLMAEGDLSNGIVVKTRFDTVTNEGKTFPRQDSQMSIKEYKLQKHKEQRAAYDSAAYDSSSVLIGRDSLFGDKTDVSVISHGQIDDEAVMQEDMLLAKDSSALFFASKNPIISPQKSDNNILKHQESEIITRDGFELKRKLGRIKKSVGFIPAKLNVDYMTPIKGGNAETSSFLRKSSLPAISGATPKH